MNNYGVTRQKIIEALSTGAKSMDELTQAVGVSKRAVTKQIAKLHEQNYPIITVGTASGGWKYEIRKG